ncbi:hypothetical protein [Microbacterium sp. No. 7]|uniref:hypothetical protein n=1 Tax=Microbacterium sp. No. 7 TaxID=1714373 RepID=UPI0006D118E7|nr:hypothetical protein [Microbacterium sp. No. 7]ALJ21350.1 hypothetical protein AOA12_16150 [Microbacterium sp. No. 7]
MSSNESESAHHDGVGAVGRRTIVKGAAWSLPVIATAIAAPMAAATAGPIVAIAGLGPTTIVGVDVTTVVVVASGNATADIDLTLPAGFVWADGHPSLTRTIGQGAGDHPVPAFRATAAAPSATITAVTSSASTTATTTVVSSYAMQALGHMNIIADGPDEFRADFTIIVPRGVRPSKIFYNYYPTTANATLELTKHGGDNSTAVRNSVDQAYGIVHVQDLGNDVERLFIHARGDSDIGNVPTADLEWVVRATWPAHADTTLTFPLRQQYRGATGRPVAINAWDHTTSGLNGYVGPNAQAGWGNVVDASSAGGLNPNLFHIDALVSGRTAAQGNDRTTEVYYQFVHEDGTVASITPTPRIVSIPNNTGYTNVSGVLLRWGDPALGASIAFDKPGYWRLLVWPQSSNSSATSTATPDGVAWSPGADTGWQVGSVFWKLPASA